MSTCGKPVTVTVGATEWARPCDKEPCHEDSACAAWFRFGTEHEPSPLDPFPVLVEFGTVPCEVTS